MRGRMVAVSAATTVRSDAPASASRRPLTERRMARTRRELADAAARLFIERGYDQTTVEDIVAEVEISARTFFQATSSSKPSRRAFGTRDPGATKISPK